MTQQRCSVCGELTSLKHSRRFRGTCGERACLQRADERRRIADKQRREGK